MYKPYRRWQGSSTRKLLNKMKITWNRFILLWIVLSGILCLSILASILLGSVSLDSGTVLRIVANHISGQEIFSPDWSKATESIVWQLRFPKTIAGIVIGAGLSITGILMQTLTKNALAEPYVLGISSGASAGAVFSLLLGIYIPFIGRIPISLGAFIGAISATLLIYILSVSIGMLRIGNMLLIGIALSAGFSSLTSIIIFLTPNAHALKTALFWLSGSLSAITWNDIGIIYLILIVLLLTYLLFHKVADLLLLGDDMARSQGISVFIAKTGIIICSSLLTALIVSLCGIIGFVGLMIPHIGRIFVGSKHSRLMSVSMILGAILILWSDIAARVCFAPEELPIGVVTSAIGAPFFIFLLKNVRE